MTNRSDNVSIGTPNVKSIVAVDKDGRIEILDAEVLDLVTGGAAAAAQHALRDNGNCGCGGRLE